MVENKELRGKKKIKVMIWHETLAASGASYAATQKEMLRPTAVINLVPGGWRSSSFWKMSGEPLEEGGVEEQRNEEASLLLKESMALPEVAAGIVSVLRPVTLSLDVHWDEDSELSVAVRT